MPKITFKRKGEYLQAVLHVLVEHGGSAPAAEAIQEASERLDLSDYEKGLTPKNGNPRWWAILQLYSIDMVKADWIKKEDAVWQITDKGREALKMDPEAFVQEARRLYAEWQKTAPPKKRRIGSESEAALDNARVSSDEKTEPKYEIHLGGASFEYHPLEEPKKVTLREIVRQAAEGEIGIPTFQRPFKWDVSDIQELFESLLEGFYVGSFLYWDTGGEPVLSVDPVAGATPKVFRPRSIILDGQQRITSIHYALRRPNLKLVSTKYPYLFFVDLQKFLNPSLRDSGFVEAYRTDDIEKHGFLEKRKQFRDKIFPLFELEQYYDWLEDFQEYLEEVEQKPREEAKQIKKVCSQALQHLLERFEIPVITLPASKPIEHVAVIFERINSKGEPLTVFDLLNARLLKFEINLRTELLQAALEQNPLIHEWSEGADIVPVYLLQLVSLRRRGSAKKSDLLRIDQAYMQAGIMAADDFRSDWGAAAGYLNQALSRIFNLKEDGFGVIGFNRIPHKPMAIVLAAALAEIGDKADAARGYEKVKMWYWGSVITSSYEKSVEGRMAQDLKELQAWFKDDASLPLAVTDARKLIDDQNFSLRDADEPARAVYKGILNLVSKRGARDFLNGQVPEFNTLNDHHIFPASRAKEYGVKNAINSILNRTLIAEDTNKNYIRAKKPKQYLQAIMDDQGISEAELVKRLESHFIDAEAFKFLMADDFEGFLARREQLMKTALRELIY